MKPIQNYSGESLDRLKQWITEMNNSGHDKYFEIFVDGMRIVHKTNVVEEFDRYKKWIDQETQQIKVLTYNTPGSHRSKPFEFRTEKYPVENNYKEIAETLKKQNAELLMKLSEAEAYIQKLENAAQQTASGNFNLETILSSFGDLTKQFPGLKDSLGGLGYIFKSAPSEKIEKNENSEVTFKRKSGSNKVIKSKEPLNTDSREFDQEEKESYTFKTEAKLGEKNAKKMVEIMRFFADNPAYLDVVTDIIVQNKINESGNDFLNHF